MSKHFPFHKYCFDAWSLLHIVVAFFITYGFLYVGLDLLTTWIVVFAIIIIYEGIEQTYLIGKLFRRREKWTNSFCDVLSGFLGVALAYVGFLPILLG